MPVTAGPGGLALRRTEYYPGWTGDGLGAESLGPFRDADEGRAWQLDFHYPSGVLPLSHVLLDATFAGAQAAADALPVAASRGLTGRLVGPHVYTSAVEVPSPEARTERAVAAANELSRYPQRFADDWAAKSARLAEGYQRLTAVDPARLEGQDLVAHLDAAVDLFRVGFRLHFDVMYRLLAVDAGFEVVCGKLGVTDAERAALLPSGETSIREADVALWRLAQDAREAGLTAVFTAYDGPELLDALRDEPAAGSWLAAFASLLDRIGERADGIIDVGAPSWREEPVRPLHVIRSWALGHGVDPTQSADRMEHQRTETLASVRGRLTPSDRRGFDRVYAATTAASFPWWNEEHNSHIDLKLHLALRRAGRAVAVRDGRPADDGLYLFHEEARQVAARERGWAELDDLVAERRQWRTSWQDRRPDLPRTLGATDSEVLDPVIRQVIGLTHSIPADPASTTLHGLGVSTGVARGVARIVRSADELDRVGDGEILVCEATSPSWTPTFARLAACVCDSGGALTHAAIICREYALPCVCGVGMAMRVISDGDLVEVDGTAGTVTVLRSQQGS